MSQMILERIEAQEKKLAKLRPLPQVALKRLQSKLAIEWTYNSNAVEGKIDAHKKARNWLAT